MFAPSRRTSIFASGLLFGVFGLALAQPDAQAQATAQPMAAEGEDEEPVETASIKIELKQASGKVLKYDGAQLEWGADGNVEFKADNHVHDIALRIDRAEGGGKAIDLTVGYARDGHEIMAETTIASEIKKREVIRIEGGIAIAITVSAKASKQEQPKEEPPKEEPPRRRSRPRSSPRSARSRAAAPTIRSTG
ncbi:MAG: hypothetical protein U0168_22995 [Nannocystaceae bacterium]